MVSGAALLSASLTERSINSRDGNGNRSDDFRNVAPSAGRASPKRSVSVLSLGLATFDPLTEALASALEHREPSRPRLPLTEPTGNPTNWAEQVDEILGEGFGRS